MKYCIAYDGSAEAEGALQLLQLLFREKEVSSPLQCSTAAFLAFPSLVVPSCNNQWALSGH